MAACHSRGLGRPHPLFWEAWATAPQGPGAHPALRGPSGRSGCWTVPTELPGPSSCCEGKAKRIKGGASP